MKKWFIATCVCLVAAAAFQTRSLIAAGPDHVDITWMSISNLYYEFGSTGVITDGYISRVPRSLFFGGGGGLASTRAAFASDTAAVKRVLDALGGPSRVNLLLTGHSHFDHSLDTASWSKLTGAPIIGSKTTCLQAEAEDVPAARCRAVGGGEVIPIADGVTMRVVRWNHSGNSTSNPEQHDPVELTAVPKRDPATGGLRAGVAEDFPNGGGNRAFLFTVDGPEGRFSWFFQNSASDTDLTKPIVVDGVDYGAPLDNLKTAMRDAGLESVALWIGNGGKPVADLVLPVLKPKAFLPVHWDGLWGAFEAGAPGPYRDGPLEAALAAAGVELVRPMQYMDKWRLDRSGIHAVANDAVKRALGFARQATVTPDCAALTATVRLPNATVTTASLVAAGSFSPGGSVSSVNARRFAALPAFCRVLAKLTPTADSDINVEVWLPVENWNNKYQAVGNGGWAGSINHAAMADALARGYAASSTDTGHAGATAEFAPGHPEKLIDYAYRSEHEMAVASKHVISTFFGAGPSRSYWTGCSNGGKQGLTEAQRYPDDFDGIVAGAPAANWTGRAVQSLMIAQANLATKGGRLPAEKLPVIHDAVLAACDALDGVSDGVLEDPHRCRFDPAALACTGADGPRCLTSGQIDTVRRIYAPVVDPRTGEAVFPGHEPGSELGWTVMAGPRPFGTGLDHARYVVFDDANWDFRTFDLGRDMPRVNRDRDLLNATNPDLSRFFKRGGKLIQYHGWSDPQISPASSIEYYRSVLPAVGPNAVKASYRLFMVPGMAHCGGGDGTDTFDMLPALEEWVEHGKSPERIEASRVEDGRTMRTRPLCPYPSTAVYSGRGSTDDSQNFACAMPPG
jgi:feruloyl esterase